MKIIARAFIGFFTGSLLALIAIAFFSEWLFDYYPPRDGFTPDLIGAVIGGIVGTFVAVVAGSWEFRGRLGNTIVGMVLGCLLGLVGAVVFSKVVVATSGLPWMDGKEEASYRFVGILFGIPVSTIVGGVAGIFYRERFISGKS